MEPHPVPQNIMEVEFKLFGSFTIKQFMKILAGSLIGLVFFALDIPVLIKIPLILVSVGIGLLMATVNNFGTWLEGFLKALFISPRYVWVKDSQTPDMLKKKSKKKTDASQKVKKATNKKRIELEELPMDQLFATRRKVEGGEASPDALSNEEMIKQQNLNRQYQREFQQQKQPSVSQRPNSLAGTATNSTPIKMGQNLQANLPQVKNTQPRAGVVQSQDQSNQTQPKKKKVQDYEDEIRRLKFELGKLEKDELYDKKSEEILSQINDMYREIKLLEGQTGRSQTMQDSNEKVVNIKGESLKPEKAGMNLFGIVVDKKDNVLSDVKISFRNLETGEIVYAVSKKDGRFATEESLPKGEYEIKLEGGNQRFHTYKIKVADQKLPAYKFRAK